MRKRLLGFVVLGAGVTALALAAFAFANGGAPRNTQLSGANEVPAAPAANTGTAHIELNQGQGTVCWELTYSGPETLVAAHVHKAPAGVNGLIVVPLSPPTTGSSSGCRDVDPDLIKEIRQNPEEFYVNVHSTLHPGGAARGQLSVPGQE